VIERYDQELVLRFLSCTFTPPDPQRAPSDVETYLTDSMMALAEKEAVEQASMRESFVGVFSLLANAIGPDAFRRHDANSDRFVGGFSVSAFETVTVGLASNLPAWLDLRPESASTLLRTRLTSMWGDTDNWRRRTGSGIRGTDRIPFTIRYGSQHFRI
jgi:hypothetical protein